MNSNLHKASLYILYLLPISLITGPAIPDISITLICIFFLIYTIKNNKYDWLRENWIKIGLIFWLSLCLISFFSINKLLSFSDSIIFIRLILFSIAIYAWVIQEKTHLKNLLIIFFITIIFIISDTLFQFLSYDPTTGFGKDIFGFTPRHYGRLTGPFDDQVPGSHLTRFFFISILLFIYYFNKNKIISIFFFIYILLNGITIFVSGEAMSIATFLLGLVVLIVIFKEYRKFFLLSLIFLILLITFILKNHRSYDYDIIESTPFHLGLVIEKKFQCDENSLEICSKNIITNPEFITVIKNFGESVYGKLYKQAYKMWLDNKITGIGLNNFEFLCEQNSKYRIAKENYGNCGSHPHNFYLQWLVESGIIGFCLFLIFIIMVFKKLLNNINYTPAKIGLTSLIVIFWPIMSTGSLLKNWFGIEMFLVIGLSLVCTKRIFTNIHTNN